MAAIAIASLGSFIVSLVEGPVRAWWAMANLGMATSSAVCAWGAFKGRHWTPGVFLVCAIIGLGATTGAQLTSGKPLPWPAFGATLTIIVAIVWRIFRRLSRTS